MKITFALCAILLAGAVSINAADKAKDPDAAFAKKDTNGDGKLSKAEFVGKKEGEAKTKAEASFDAKDKDKDGFLSKEEFNAASAKKAK